MRHAVVALLLTLLAAPPATACIVDGLPRVWRDDLVVLGTVTAVASRRVDACGADYEEVRATLEVEQVLWADADRPPPRTLLVHSADLAGAGAAPPFHGRLGRRWVFVLRRTRLLHVYRCLSARPPETARLPWEDESASIVGGRVSPTGEVSLQVRCANPGTSPCTFAPGGGYATLVVASWRDSTSAVAIPPVGGPLVVPPGRYRDLTLQFRAPELAGLDELEVTSLDSPLPLPRTSEVALDSDAPPLFARAVVHGQGWPFEARWIERPPTLDPDDPALARRAPTVREPLSGLALGLLTALLWTFRRHKSLARGAAGR